MKRKNRIRIKKKRKPIEKTGPKTKLRYKIIHAIENLKKYEYMNTINMSM